MTGVHSALNRIAGLQARVTQLTPQPTADFGSTLERAMSTPLGSGPASSQLAWSTRPALTAQQTMGAWLGAIPAMSAAHSGAWQAGLPERAGPHLAALERAASEAGIDPRMLAAVTWAESGFVPEAVSHAGAIGLTQLMPATAAALGVDPHDPSENLRGGARYLREQLDRFGSVELMLAAYNAGPGSVQRARGIPDIPETQAYVPKVLGYYRRLGGTT